MRFDNRIKGEVTETVLATLLEGAGYRVIRAGIERIVPDLRGIPEITYQSLGFPQELRSMPDLIVLDRDHQEAHMVEVKFRARWDRRTLDELCETLGRQHRHWKDALTIVVIAESIPPGRGYNQDHIRVLEPGFKGRIPEGATPEQAWDAFMHLSHAFDRLRGEFFDRQQEADVLTRLIMSLGGLEPPATSEEALRAADDAFFELTLEEVRKRVDGLTVEMRHRGAGRELIVGNRNYFVELEADGRYTNVVTSGILPSLVYDAVAPDAKGVSREVGHRVEFNPGDSRHYATFFCSYGLNHLSKITAAEMTARIVSAITSRIKDSPSPEVRKYL